MRARQTRSAPTRCLALGVLLGAGLLAGCAGPHLELAAEPSQPSVTLIGVEIRLTILPNTWKGYPSDLARHYTPVEIQIENDRPDELQVRYADFLAVDEARNQYRPVTPAEAARALFGGRPPSLLAWHDPRWPYPFWPVRPWPPFYGPYYPYPYFDPDYPYRSPRAPAYDILTLGLREGRVLPGARVQGFLYLQQATQKGNLLTLSWTAVSADGKPLTTLSSQFRIVR